MIDVVFMGRAKNRHTADIAAVVGALAIKACAILCIAGFFKDGDLSINSLECAVNLYPSLLYNITVNIGVLGMCINTLYLRY